MTTSPKPSHGDEHKSYDIIKYMETHRVDKDFIKTNIVEEHFHIFKMGKIRTSVDNGHFHLIIYVGGKPVIGKKNGHRHEA